VVQSLTRAALLAAAALSVACSSQNTDPFRGGSTSCDTTGTWAIFVEVGVEWQSAVISPGAGTVIQWIKSTIALGPDGQLRSSAHACGIGAQHVPLGSPWFSTMAFPQIQVEQEWTGVQFLPALFDTGLLEEIPIPISISSPDPHQPTIGDQFRTSPSPFVFGLKGLDPTAPWPKTDQIMPLLYDSDQDGFPGITGVPFSGPVPGEAQGTVFQDPRLNLAVNPPRASRLFLALRTRAGLEGKLTSCVPPRLEGQVTPDTLLIETRNVACLVDGTNNQACNVDQITFIDTNLPVFKANGTSRFVGIQVPASTSCEELRTMQY